jgi:hypothetical protein
MKRYLLSIEQPDGPPPKSVDLEQIRNPINALEREMKDAGVWVFNDHLGPPTEAMVLRPDDGEVSAKDGPYRKGRSTSAGSRSSRRTTGTRRSRGHGSSRSRQPCRSRCVSSNERSDATRTG